MIKPITPKQCTSERVFPDFVIEAFNHCIQKNFSGKTSIVRQNEVLGEICKRGEIERAEVFANSYLDVEDLYRANGWGVYYDKPAYNESYEAYFQFTIK